LNPSVGNKFTNNLHACNYYSNNIMMTPV